MKQRLFKTKVLEQLERDIRKNRLYYTNMKENCNWLEKMYIDASNTNYYIESSLDVEPFDLIIGGPETDAQNAKIIYEKMKFITPTQAVTSELWSYMAHIEFPKYMANRWKINEKSSSVDSSLTLEEIKKLETVIKQRYFAIRGSKGIIRNGIARLWWGAYWGYDEKREDPYELVDIIFEKQETYEHISERLFNRNKNILIASLEAIKGHHYDTRKIRSLYGKINSYGSDKCLDALSYEDAKQLMNELDIEINSEITIETTT